MKGKYLSRLRFYDVRDIKHLKSGFFTIISQGAWDKSAHESLSWYNQTGGTVTPQFGLFALNQKIRAVNSYSWCHLLQPYKGKKRLRWLWFGSKITCGKKKSCPVDSKSLSSSKTWVLIHISKVLCQVFISFCVFLLFGSRSDRIKHHTWVR